MNKEQMGKLNQLEKLIKACKPHTPIQKDIFEEALKIVDEIKNVKDYKQLALSFIGMRIDDFFCNGFFGSGTYDLEDAEITRIYRDEDDDIVIEVKKRNSQYDYGYFEGDWADWQSVYEHLDEWVNGVKHY